MSLVAAIDQLQAEVDILMAQKLQVGGPTWFLLGAKATALSMLKSAKKRALLDAPSFERYRKACRASFVNELGNEPDNPPA